MHVKCFRFTFVGSFPDLMILNNTDVNIPDTMTTVTMYIIIKEHVTVVTVKLY